jgi:hypothetical protein
MNTIIKPGYAIILFVLLIAFSGCSKQKSTTPKDEFIVSKAIYDTIWIDKDKNIFMTKLNRYEENFSEAKAGDDIKIKRISGNSFVVVWTGDSIHDYNKTYQKVIQTADGKRDSLITVHATGMAWQKKADSLMYQYPYGVDNPDLIAAGKAPSDGKFHIKIICSDIQFMDDISQKTTDIPVRIVE